MKKNTTYCYKGSSDFVIENGIWKGAEVSYITKHGSYGEYILEQLKAAPEFIGQIDGATGKQKNFREMTEKSVKCAMWLKEQNVQPSDVIGICTLNQMDMYVPCFASLYIGAVFNPWWNDKITKGWLHMGDLVHYDEEGNVFVTDRIKDMIKYRGQHVSPAIIELVLQAHPAVSEVGVVAEPNEIDDEHAVAFVVKRPNVQVTKEELLNLVENKLPDYMKLRGGLQFLKELPHTSSGKISKSQLRELTQNGKAL